MAKLKSNMMSREIDKLIKQVHQMGFDDRIDFSLRHQIARQQPAFSIPYRVDDGKDMIVFDLHFERNVKGDSYRFDRFDASRFRTIHIPALMLGDVDLGKLDQQLSHYASHGTVLSHAGPTLIPDFRDSLLRLERTEAGRKIANLLRVRYLPEEYKQSEKGYKFGFDISHNRYFVKSTFSLKQKLVAARCCHLLDVDMDLKTPKVNLSTLRQPENVPDYTLVATVFNFKTGGIQRIGNGRKFNDPGEVVAMITGIDQRLFSREFVQNHLPRLRWHLCSLSLQDANNKTNLLSIRSTDTHIDNSSKDSVALIIEVTHPSLGNIQFNSQHTGNSRRPIQKEDLGTIQQSLMGLGLLPLSKDITTRVVPNLKNRTVKKKRRGGGMRPQ